MIGQLAGIPLSSKVTYYPVVVVEWANESIQIIRIAQKVPGLNPAQHTNLFMVICYIVVSIGWNSCFLS